MSDGGILQQGKRKNLLGLRNCTDGIKVLEPSYKIIFKIVILSGSDFQAISKSSRGQLPVFRRSVERVHSRAGRLLYGGLLPEHVCHRRLENALHGPRQAGARIERICWETR